LLLLATLAISGCSSPDTGSPNVLRYQDIQNSELFSFVSEEVIEKEVASSKVCNSARKRLVTREQFDLLENRVANIKKVSSYNPWRASAWLSGTNTPKPLNEDLYSRKGQKYIDEIRAASVPFFLETFKSYSSKNGEKLLKADRQLFFQKWEPTFVTQVKTYCKLNTTYSDRYLALAVNFNNLLNSIQTSADSVPWYPEGFEEWSGDPSLAWKSVGGYCQLGDSCWRVQVYASAGCSSLYGEMNLQDTSGNVIDYTNDRVGSLPAGSSAILEFSSYNDYASTAYITELNCY